MWRGCGTHHMRTQCRLLMDALCARRQPRVFFPYCAGLTIRAPLHSSVTGSVLIGFDWHLKSRHAQLNRKSNIFGLQNGSFQGRPLVKGEEDAGYEGGTGKVNDRLRRRLGLWLGFFFFFFSEKNRNARWRAELRLA